MNFDREINLEELPDYDVSPVPAGWYTARIADAELRTTKRGNGQYLAIQYSILAPTHQGRSVWGNVTISNPSEVATRIGLAQLKELMAACGLRRLADPKSLVGQTVQVKVVVRQDDKYGESNEVKGWRAAGASLPAPRPAPIGFAPPPPVAAAPAPAPAAPPAAPPPADPPVPAPPPAPAPQPRRVAPPWAAPRSE